MKILQIAGRFPWPLYDGGAIGIYHLVRSAHANGHNVTFLSYPLEDVSQTAAGVEAMSQFSNVVLTTRPLPSRNSVLLRTMFSGAYPIERRMMPEMYHIIDELLSRERFDVVHLDHSHVGKYGIYIRKKYHVPVVLRQHNYETLIYQRFTASEHNPIKRFVGKVHGHRLRNVEREIMNNVDAIAAITEQDKKRMEQESPRTKFFVVPAGVDTDYFAPDAVVASPTRLLWVGGMDWEPNREALGRLLREIFPRIVADEPSSTLDIVGAGTECMRTLAAPFGRSVEIHGKVPDVRPYLARAALMVVPLAVGGGMRVKLLEFFAAGKPVVSTTVGAEGNRARDGVEIEIADAPHDFVQKTVSLMRSPDRARTMGIAARQLAVREYSWSSVAERMTEVYEFARSRKTSHAHI